MIPLIIIMAVMYAISQGCYIFIDREDNPHISYRVFKSLRKVSPDKWDVQLLGPADSFAVYYPEGKAKGTGWGKGQAVYMHTFIGAFRLGMAERKKRRLMTDLSKMWLDDINEYQKKQEEEANKEIEKSSKEFEEYAKNITAGRLDPKAITWSEITSDKLFEMQAQIDELRNKVRESSQ